MQLLFPVKSLRNRLNVSKPGLVLRPAEKDIRATFFYKPPSFDCNCHVDCNNDATTQKTTFVGFKTGRFARSRHAPPNVSTMQYGSGAALLAALSSTDSMKASGCQAIPTPSPPAQLHLTEPLRYLPDCACAMTEPLFPLPPSNPNRAQVRQPRCPMPLARPRPRSTTSSITRRWRPTGSRV